MHERERRPLARQDGLVIQDLGDEILIYDRDQDMAHCLGAGAAAIWRGCDGKSDVSALARLVSGEDAPAQVVVALEELSDKGLLAESPTAERFAGADLHAVKPSAGWRALRRPLR